MNQIPDIRGLYQQKYLPMSSEHSRSFKFKQFARSVHNPKTRLIAQRMLNNHQSRPLIKCVKVVKNPIESVPFHLSQTSYYPRKNTKEITLKNHHSGGTQSMNLQQKNNIIGQLMRISHQQMIELQSSVGGERRLRNMFQQFFHKRSKTKQKLRQQRKNHDFIPLHPRSDHEGRRNFQERNRIIDRSKITQSAMYEKQLAPWNSSEGQFI